MDFLGNIIEFLDMKMQTPQPYGWFHLLCVILTIVITLVLCKRFKDKSRKWIAMVVFATAILVAVLEVYKQINFTFSYDGEVVKADFMWFAFPWQFCSMPMYVGLLTGVFRKGKAHDSLMSFLATYSIFAGICVMVYPVSVFVDTIGINIQTMVCHGSMIVIGVYLLYSGYVKLEGKTLLRAFPVFLCGVGAAMTMNEIAYRAGLLQTDEFNMFFISPHCKPSLPVYSIIQGFVPYPWCLLIYVSAFTLAAYLILIIAMLGKRFIRKK